MEYHHDWMCYHHKESPKNPQGGYLNWAHLQGAALAVVEAQAYQCDGHHWEEAEEDDANHRSRHEGEEFCPARHDGDVLRCPCALTDT